MNHDVDPDWGTPPGKAPVASSMASDRGCRKSGFTGTAAKETAAQAAGLTTLASDEFGSGPRMPMVPAPGPERCRGACEETHDGW